MIKLRTLPTLRQSQIQSWISPWISPPSSADYCDVGFDGGRGYDDGGCVSCGVSLLKIIQNIFQKYPKNIEK